MRQTNFPIKTFREAPKDELALNARLLARAGFIHKIGAGIYSFLPLGLRVLQRIEHIVREEMNTIGGQEVLLPALHPKDYWETTDRWNKFDALYKIKAHEEREYGLGPTHEEIVVPVAKTIIQSYKDLPLYLYQIQTKFRDEPRAKSGLLRGREFLMKDLYSFHTDQKNLEEYYEKAARAYERIFVRCGLEALRTKAGGGTFAQFSDEYQVRTEAGEDTIFICKNCHTAWNKEILRGGVICVDCKTPMQEARGAEVGNIFKLGTKYSTPFDLTYQDDSGAHLPVVMGCYGIGISRIMGVVSEVHHDERGLIWPEEIAPFAVHLLKFKARSTKLEAAQNKFFEDLEKRGVDVLYDDRSQVSDGVKLMEADLVGFPWRVIVSHRSLEQGKAEIKRRSEDQSALITPREFLKQIAP